MTSEPSGRLYTLVTEHWHRIAAGLVIVIGVLEFVVGGLTADSGVEFYLMAWAGATGGLWFLFEKAEKALSDEARGWILGTLRADRVSSLGSIPQQFAALFDRVFGERHWSWACFRRSCVATVASVVLLALVWLSLMVVSDPSSLDGRRVSYAVWLFPFTVMVNLIPDYLSLLETRLLIRWEQRWKRDWENPIVLIVLDFFAPTAISLLFTLGWIALLFFLGHEAGASRLGDAVAGGAFLGVATAFFTSVWLWLYAASVLVSRVLLRMNDGVGFLLRVTDVERQPFRSMGFVSVIIVSGLFALGLPLVLL